MQNSATIQEDRTLDNGQRIVRTLHADPHELSRSWWDITQGLVLETTHHGTKGDDQMLPYSTGNNLFYAGDGNDHVIGNIGHDVMFGESGDDHLEGRGGNDQLWGGNGNDWLEGGSGDDHLAGMAGDDRLDGGDGNDLFIDGEGNDIMTGGAGSDTFRWSFPEQNPHASFEVDTIRDFTLGEDRLVLSPDWQDTDSNLLLSLRQEGSMGVIELRNARQQVFHRINLENTDLLSVRDDQGSLIETLSSHAALQRLIEQGALDSDL